MKHPKIRKADVLSDLRSVNRAISAAVYQLQHAGARRWSVGWKEDARGFSQMAYRTPSPEERIAEAERALEAAVRAEERAFHARRATQMYVAQMKRERAEHLEAIS